MRLIKFLFSLFLLLIALAARPMTLILMIFWGPMKLGMDKNFEP